MKYFIHLAYKGTNYHGWQRQPNHISVQETLENAIEKMTGEKISCICCGRTDAGVHASQFFCHIKVETSFEFDPVFRLNHILPNDISIFGFIEVDEFAHAQYDAIWRTYTYYIHTSKNAFLSDISSIYPKEKLDIAEMKKATALLLTYRDYRAMCKQPHLYKTTLCNITEARLEADEQANRLKIVLTANRFLRGMVRLLVAHILKVGYGKMSLLAFENCLKTGIRAPYFRAAHPQGLFLSRVEYPYLKMPNASLADF